MILDATAGNRTLWKVKDSKHIIYIDMERKLEVPPTIFCDNTITPFLPCTFDSIFYDPPHMFGDKSSIYVHPDAASFKAKWPKYGEIPRYYGGDKYKNQLQLIRHIHFAQKEFYRILKDDGLLWLKWNELAVSINKILGLFENWNVMIEVPIHARTQTAGKHQTWWVCLSKEKREFVQTTLL